MEECRLTRCSVDRGPPAGLTGLIEVPRTKNGRVGSSRGPERTVDPSLTNVRRRASWALAQRRWISCPAREARLGEGQEDECGK